VYVIEGRWGGLYMLLKGLCMSLKAGDCVCY